MSARLLTFCDACGKEIRKDAQRRNLTMKVTIGGGGDVLAVALDICAVAPCPDATVTQLVGAALALAGQR